MAEPNIILFMAQLVSFTISVMLALFLLFSIFYTRHASHAYKVARCHLIVAMFILAAQYLVQMIFGFRARGADIGAVVNILFYSPVAYMIVYSTIRLGTGNHYLKQFNIFSFASMGIILIAFVSGLIYYHSLRMPVALIVMSVVHVATRFIVVLHPASELSRIRRKVEEETAGDIEGYHIYMRNGIAVLYGISLLVVVSIFWTRLIVLIGPLFFLILLYYVVSFVAFGISSVSMSEMIEEVISVDEDTATASTEESAPALSPEQIAQIDALLVQWQAGHGYAVANLTCASLAQQLNINKKVFSQYLSQQHDKTFRVWLSDIRIEEVKRRLLSDKNYNHESIALECGFASRTWMHTKFKASTGDAPNEWRRKQMDKGNV